MSSPRDGTSGGGPPEPDACPSCPSPAPSSPPSPSPRSPSAASSPPRHPPKPPPTRTWDRLAQCESSGDWHIDTGNGYYGGLQFSMSTWHAHGGSGNPAGATKSKQIKVAEKVLQQPGLGRVARLLEPPRPARHARQRSTTRSTTRVQHAKTHHARREGLEAHGRRAVRRHPRPHRSAGPRARRLAPPRGGEPAAEEPGRAPRRAAPAPPRLSGRWVSGDRNRVRHLPRSWHPRGARGEPVIRNHRDLSLPGYCPVRPRLALPPDRTDRIVRNTRVGSGASSLRDGASGGGPVGARSHEDPEQHPRRPVDLAVAGTRHRRHRTRRRTRPGRTDGRLGPRRRLRVRRQLEHRHRQRLLRRAAVQPLDVARLRRIRATRPTRSKGDADRGRREGARRPGLGRLARLLGEGRRDRLVELRVVELERLVLVAPARRAARLVRARPARCSHPARPTLR